MSVKFGIIGTGCICNDFALAMKNHGVKKDAKIVAVADSNKSEAEKFAKEFDIPKVYDSYEQLLEDNEVDVVYNGLINTKHVEPTLKAAKNKKHIVCETPLSISALDTETMVFTAKENNVFLMEGIWSRCMPSYDLIKKEIESGSIGQVKHINARFEMCICDRPRIKEAHLGGSCLYDVGLYLLQLAFFVVPFRHLKSVNVKGCLLETGVDKCGNITLLFDNDVSAFLSYHCEIDGCTNATIYGDKGKIQIPDTFWAPSKVIVNDKTHDFPVEQQDQDNYCYRHGSHLQYEIEHIVECIKSGWKESPKIPLKETLALSHTLFALFKQLDGVQKC